ncbi:hypothetical protein pb186bvf_007771 [Paramecium bursaria]
MDLVLFSTYCVDIFNYFQILEISDNFQYYQNKSLMSTEQTPSVIYPTFHPPQNQNPNQPYIIYVPQIVNPQQQIDGQPQPQPIYCQPQQVYSQIQQPLMAQQPYVNIQGDAQQYAYVPVVHIPKIIKEASIQEKHNLALKSTGLLLFTSLVSLVLMIISNSSAEFRRFQYDPFSKRFYAPFYIFIAVLVLTIIHTFMNFQKVRKNHADVISFLIFTTSFAFIWQGAFSSGFTQYYWNYYYFYQDFFTLCLIYGVGQACVTFIGILAYIKTEKKELNYQDATFKIVIPNLGYTLAMFGYKVDDTFLIISFICSVVAGFYYIFVLKNFLSKGFKDLKTNEYKIASILIFGQMLVPFYNQDD